MANSIVDKAVRKEGRYPKLPKQSSKATLDHTNDINLFNTVFKYILTDKFTTTTALLLYCILMGCTRGLVCSLLSYLAEVLSNPNPR